MATRSLGSTLKYVGASYQTRGMMVSIGSEAPALDAEILAAAFEGSGLEWIVHPNDPEFQARLREAVRRLLEKFL